jgi:Protein of unknown function (DUF3040)
MPLSEEEQRILHQIERQFYESDPEFAQSVGKASLYRHATRRAIWGAVVLAIGLALVVSMLRVHVAASFGGFLIMLAAAFSIEKNVRAMGRAGIDEVSRSAKAKRLRDSFGSPRRRPNDN